jgi:hypothetical protein
LNIASRHLSALTEETEPNKVDGPRASQGPHLAQVSDPLI